jgi:hypothetical protein
MLARHPTFCKIVQMSSHMLLSVMFVVPYYMHIFRGACCTNLENKTLVYLIVEKALSVVINHQKGVLGSRSRGLLDLEHGKDAKVGYQEMADLEVTNLKMVINALGSLPWGIPGGGYL